MKNKLFVLLIIAATVFSCTKEDETEIGLNFQEQSEKFVGRIIPDTYGYWLITRTTQNKAPISNSWGNINFIDGVTYYTEQKSVTRDALGYFNDAENYQDKLLTLTSRQILSFNRSLESTVIKSAGTNEIFRLMDKDSTGNVWILSSKAILSMNGQSIPFNNNIQAVDFETSNGNSFWIASSDTVYNFSNNTLKKVSVSGITGIQGTSSTIYGLKIDRNSNIWINTSSMLFRYKDKSWATERAGTFTGDNFKTVPFMDIDSKGNLWLAEKHYQAFTNLHYFNGSAWTSYKLNPQLQNWVNDIEISEDGKNVLIATNNGLQKVQLN